MIPLPFIPLSHPNCHLGLQVSVTMSNRSSLFSGRLFIIPKPIKKNPLLWPQLCRVSTWKVEAEGISVWYFNIKLKPSLDYLKPCVQTAPTTQICLWISVARGSEVAWVRVDLKSIPRTTKHYPHMCLSIATDTLPNARDTIPPHGIVMQSKDLVRRDTWAFPALCGMCLPQTLLWHRRFAFLWWRR